MTPNEHLNHLLVLANDALVRYKKSVLSQNVNHTYIIAQVDCIQVLLKELYPIMFKDEDRS